MIDLTEAKKIFKDYTSNFRVADQKVDIKIIHTMGVTKVAGYIAREMKLSEEDIVLAELIGLLHDIGRFEQAVRFNNYNDYETIDHAEFGADLLFKEKLIERFIDDRQYDRIIEKAIRNHNKFAVEEGLSERELLHANIIRDADKTDNFEVKQYQDFVSLLGKTEREAEKDLITDRVWEEFLNKSTIVSSHRTTSMDCWLSYIAWVFDYNYEPGLKYLKENDCVNKVIDRLNYQEKDTKEKIEYARKMINEYINDRLAK